MTAQQREQVQERHEQAIRDLVELEDQVEAGEVPAARAALLRERYEAEAATALRWLESHAPETEVVTGNGRERPSNESNGRTARRRSRRRRWVGATGGVVVVAALTFAVTRAVQPRPDGGVITGNMADSGGRDLSDVTVEEMASVVDENPDVVPMRLALAHRYVDAGQYEEAFSHYMQVLERSDNPEAMAHLGWLTFLDDKVDLAVPLLEESLERRPDDAEAMWFMANVRLYGQERPQQALPLLERLLARDDLGDQVEEVRAAIDDAMVMQRRKDDGGS